MNPAPNALEGDTTQDLRPELSVVRQVMARLLQLWDQQAGTLESAEARRLAALLFNGARTSAILLYHHNRLPDRDDDRTWLISALDALSSEYNTEL